MTQAVHGITEQEIFRLLCAYISIRGNGPRLEFLNLIETWAKEQWTAGDLAIEKNSLE